MMKFVNWSVTQSGGALRIEGEHQASGQAGVVRNVHHIGHVAGFWRVRRYAYDRQGRKLAQLL